MSTPLKLLAGVVLAAIFMGVFVGLQRITQRSGDLTEFKRDVREISVSIESLRDQDPGAENPQSIVVPEDFKVSFENESVIATADKRYTYHTGVRIFGPTLHSGAYDLLLKRTEAGVEVNVV